VTNANLGTWMTAKKGGALVPKKGRDVVWVLIGI